MSRVRGVRDGVAFIVDALRARVGSGEVRAVGRPADRAVFAVRRPTHTRYVLVSDLEGVAETWVVDDVGDRLDDGDLRRLWDYLRPADAVAVLEAHAERFAADEVGA